MHFDNLFRPEHPTSPDDNSAYHYLKRVRRCTMIVDKQRQIQKVVSAKNPEKQAQFTVFYCQNRKTEKTYKVLKDDSQFLYVPPAIHTVIMPIKKTHRFSIWDKLPSLVKKHGYYNKYDALSNHLLGMPRTWRRRCRRISPGIFGTRGNLLTRLYAFFDWRFLFF